MQITLVIALIIAIIAVIFALQNIPAVTVSFLFWSIHGSLALVLLVTLTVGVLISTLVSLPRVVRGKWTASGQKKKLTALESERDALRTRAETAEKEVKELEVQLASLSNELDKYLPEPASNQPPGTD